ncbi:hypothetical protein [Actinomyces bowdenii]|nr:hypothetical protein [Actinomyces bowdenii]
MGLRTGSAATDLARKNSFGLSPTKLRQAFAAVYRGFGPAGSA